MPLSSASLSSLIGSRICHDLISPIGAITNGLELLDMAGTTSGPELTLIGESVESAEARIRFFRLAFGLAGEETMPSAEISRVLADVSRTGRVAISSDVTGDVTRKEAQLAFLAAMCAENALAFGGHLGLSHAAGAWVVTAEAPRLRIEEALWTDLAEGLSHTPPTPATVQFALLIDALADLGRAAQISLSSDRIDLRF